MQSFWRKLITQPGHIRVVALEVSALTIELGDLQDLVGPTRLGLAEAVAGALLIASTHKSNESINLNAKGSGRLRQAIVDASPEGRARGFLIVNDQATRDDWGTGVLSILYTKNFEGKHPYTGMVQIADGRLETAINEYYRDSEQLVSKVGLMVTYRGDDLIARGVLVQALGGATEIELARIGALEPAELNALAESSDRPGEFDGLAARLLGDVTLEELERRDLTSFCTCGIDRIERALVLTGEADTTEALGQDAYLEVICDFCRHQYRVTAERIKSLFADDPSRWQ